MEREISGVWPHGARSAVMLTFDVDAETVWLNGNAAYPDSEDWLGSVSLGHYGPRRAVPRLLNLLAKEGVRGTFFVPGYVVEHYPEAIREIVRAGHELGHHGYRHERFFDQTPARQEAILLKSRRIFEDVLGYQAQGFRTPSGDFSRETPKLLQSLGFGYSSSMRGSDRPYRTVIDDGPSDFIEIPPRWELDDFVLFAYNLFPAEPWGQDRISAYGAGFDNYRREFDGYHRLGLCYVLMTHPQVIGKPGRVPHLAALIHHMKEAEPQGGTEAGGVWFATGSEVAEVWRLTHPREVAADGR